jgi:DNA invertase Pin-like site-specific DNA recombinase
MIISLSMAKRKSQSFGRSRKAYLTHITTIHAIGHKMPASQAQRQRTQERISRVLELYQEQLMSPLMIAKRLGISRTTVYQILRQHAHQSHRRRAYRFPPIGYHYPS